MLYLRRKTMHNIMSRNQLANWNHFETNTDSKTRNESMNDYYNCLITCESEGQSTRMCKEMLK